MLAPPSSRICNNGWSVKQWGTQICSEECPGCVFSTPSLLHSSSKVCLRSKHESLAGVCVQPVGQTSNIQRVLLGNAQNIHTLPLADMSGMEAMCVEIWCHVRTFKAEKTFIGPTYDKTTADRMLSHLRMSTLSPVGHQIPKLRQTRPCLDIL